MSSASFQRSAPWIAAILAVALYGFTLPFEFVFDDHIYLVKNPLVTDTRSLWFMGDFHAFANHSRNLGLDQDLSTNFILRPFAYLTFHINYLLHGMNPPGFRAVNIAIHCANALLVLALVRRLFRRPVKGGHAEDSGEFIAVTAALLFLVHPLHIESVTYVVQRFTSLGTTFYLAVIIAFVNFRNAPDEAAAQCWRRWSIAALLVGTFTKEFLFTAPFMIVLIDWIFFSTPLRRAIRVVLPWCVALPIIPALMLLISAAQNEGGASMSGALHVAGTWDTGEDYAWHYTLTQPGVVLTYLRLLFLPTGLNVDPDRPFCTSLLDWRVLGPVLVIGVILAASIRGHAVRREDSRRALVLCGVLWFFLTISIDSSFVPLPDVMAEHRTYLPSIGIFLALACLADILRTTSLWRPARFVVPGFLGCVVLALSVATIQRNMVWQSNVTFWTDAAAKNPKKFRPWKNLAVALSFSGQWEESAACFRHALELRPKSIDAHFGLASAEIESGRLRQGLEIAEAGLRISEHPALHFYRAVSLLKLGDDAGAMESLSRLLKLDPKLGPAHALMAHLSAKQADYDKAMVHSRAAVKFGGLNEVMVRMITDVEATARIRATLPSGP